MFLLNMTPSEFSECVKDENYTQRACEATKLIDKIIGECGCYPR